MARITDFDDRRTEITRAAPGASVPLSPARLAQAKAAYTTRRFDLRGAMTLLPAALPPQAGDLLLARVACIGQHTRLESPQGRRAALHPGDEILLCYGNRYASDQFEAVVPDDLGPCDLVAAGGIAARCLAQHARMKKATEIVPLGLVGDEAGERLNLRCFGLAPRQTPAARPFTAAVVGTSMNAGKTTTVAGLIRGMSAAGLRVGAAKVTGTGAGGDVWEAIDASACRALDFTDAGHPSTNKLPPAEIQRVMAVLIAELCAAHVDAIVLEVADGLLLDETAELVASATFRRLVDGILFAAGDAMGAFAGIEWLKRHRLPVLAVSGLLTASPLAAREAQALLDFPVLDRERLRSGAWLPQEAAGKRLPLSA